MDIRSGQAGHQTAKAIIETINLMYQNKTALSYLKELILTLQVEKERREKMATVLKRMNSSKELKIIY